MIYFKLFRMIELKIPEPRMKGLGIGAKPISHNNHHNDFHRLHFLMSRFKN